MRTWWTGSLLVLLVMSPLTRAEGRAAAAATLVEAIKNEDRTAVRALLQRRADVNALEPDGMTPLLWAAYVDDVGTVELLIGAGANPKAANRHRVTPLALAAINGNATMIGLLLKAGADPNMALPEGETVLMTAARTGKLDAVKVLLETGANVNAKEASRGQTALMWAAAEGHTAVVEALARQGAEIGTRSAGGLTALLFAVREGKIETVRALLKAGANVNEATMRPPTFTRASVPGYGKDQRPQGPTSALGLAVGSAHFELASVLLEEGADPNAATQGWTALHEMTWVRRCGLGNNNPCPRGTGTMDSLELTRRLVAHGANVNARMTQKASMGTTELSNIGATPFLLAARSADPELMRVLANLGADALLPNEDNTTPLMTAAGCGTYLPGEDPGTEREALEAVKLALELGGDVNAIDNKGNTAMHGAAYKFFPSVVRFLAEKGARIEIWNQKDRFGFAPLEIAEGILRGPTGAGDHFKLSEETAAAIREVMKGPAR